MIMNSSTGRPSRSNPSPPSSLEPTTPSSVTRPPRSHNSHSGSGRSSPSPKTSEHNSPKHPVTGLVTAHPPSGHISPASGHPSPASENTSPPVRYPANRPPGSHGSHSGSRRSSPSPKTSEHNSPKHPVTGLVTAHPPSGHISPASGHPSPASGNTSPPVRSPANGSPERHSVSSSRDASRSDKSGRTQSGSPPPRSKNAQTPVTNTPSVVNSTSPAGLSSPSNSNSSGSLLVASDQWLDERVKDLARLEGKVIQVTNQEGSSVKEIQGYLQEIAANMKKTSSGSNEMTPEILQRLKDLLNTAQKITQVIYKSFQPIEDSNWRPPLIAYARQIIRFAEGKVVLQANFLVQFASTCEAQFARWGILEDVDIAIVKVNQLLPNFTNGELCALQSALFHLYLARFHQFSDIQDAQEAIIIGKKLSEGEGRNSPSWDSQRIYLVLVHLEIARQQLGSSNDIPVVLEKLEPIAHASTPNKEELIYLCEALALECRDSDPPKRNTLNRLRGQLVKVGKLYVLPEKNSKITVPEASQLATLAFSYLTLYENNMGTDKLHKAIGYYVAATTSAIIDKKHPFRCSWLIGLGRAYKFQRQIIQATMCFQEAASLVHAIPTERMEACYQWEEIQGANLIKVYQHMLDIIPRLVGLEQHLSYRIKNIKLMNDLAQRASQAAIKDQNLSLALEFAERCRGIIFRSALEVRTLLVLPEFHQLHQEAKHKARAQSLMQAVKNLNQTSSLLSLTNTDQEEKQQQHRNAAKYVNEVRKVQRDIEGLGNFLQPISEKLIQAAQHSHIIIVNASQNYWDALIIKQGANTPQHITFQLEGQIYRKLAFEWIKSNLKNREEWVGPGRGLAKEGAKEASIEMKEVLVALWKDVVKPIIQHLRCIQQTINTFSDVEKLERITWCITGGLVFIPIHAAGDYDTQKSLEKLFNYAISSYTPDLSSLLTLNSLSHTKSQEIHVVAMQNTPNSSNLPGTMPEMKSIKELTKAHNLPCKTYVNDEATIEKVLKGLEASTSAHLACHGKQDEDDPTESFFALHDGRLTIEKLLKLKFEPKDLAFLSACYTAKGHPQMPNEALHLALTMMLLGFRSVVASMWALSDECAPIVTASFYNRVIKNGKVDLTKVASALHFALHELRANVGEHMLLQWCPIIHFGV
ncbi:Protein kinase rad3 [Ceratobasidium theobromae]|uniref:Protein kinase rad3 n=1 Tax=Ceratobasidium theobromae TaxID=1582974 RepID=A0A5N5QA36_9AGAM|nr:Protein kinase rad3 [Ceratobasidium theobromae]